MITDSVTDLLSFVSNIRKDVFANIPCGQLSQESAKLPSSCYQFISSLFVSTTLLNKIMTDRIASQTKRTKYWSRCSPPSITAAAAVPQSPDQHIVESRACIIMSLILSSGLEPNFTMPAERPLQGPSPSQKLLLALS